MPQTSKIQCYQEPSEANLQPEVNLVAGVRRVAPDGDGQVRVQGNIGEWLVRSVGHDLAETRSVQGGHIDDGALPRHEAIADVVRRRRQPAHDWVVDNLLPPVTAKNTSSAVHMCHMVALLGSGFGSFSKKGISSWEGSG